jgi:phosphatidylglycerophosphatase A
VSGTFRWRDRAALAIATVGYLGCLPYHRIKFKKMKGSGFLGTLAGWGLLWFLPMSGAFFSLIFAGVLILSVAASQLAEKQLTPDDPRIVIDEVAGIFVACLGLPRLAAPMLLAFVFFRLFDVIKGPWGRAASRLPGGWGIVADDLVAGLLANIAARASLWALAVLAPYFGSVQGPSTLLP